jgi:hypothetical protein
MVGYMMVGYMMVGLGKGFVVVAVGYYNVSLGKDYVVVVVDYIRAGRRVVVGYTFVWWYIVVAHLDVDVGRSNNGL